MKTRNSKITIISILSVLMVTMLACAFGGVSLNRDSATVNISLNEDQVNSMLANTTFTNDNPNDILRKIDRVEMYDGYMRLYGTAVTPDGTEVKGSYDVELSTQNDLLSVKIIDADIAGIDMSDERLAEANQKIADALTKSVRESQGEVLYKSAAITDGKLTMTVQVNFEK